MAYFQTDSLVLNRLTEASFECIMDAAGQPVNVVDRHMLDEFEQAFDLIANDRDSRLLVLRSAKKNNFATGPKSQMLASVTCDELCDLAQRGQRLCNKLTRMNFVTAALIGGSCLGGGLDLALACDHRFAIAQSANIFGFPELELGLIPMWGATQRLPRLVGLERSLRLLLGGKRINTATALEWGLLDAVVADDPREAVQRLSGLQKRSPRELPLRTLRQKIRESTSLGRRLIFRGAK